jgi:hypothetical protein
MILLYGTLALIFTGVYFFQELETGWLDKGRSFFSNEEFEENDSIIDLSSANIEDLSTKKTNEPSNKALDSIFSSFRKEYDSIHGNSLYFDKIKKPDNWETGAYLYIVRSNNDIELRIKLNLISKKAFGLLGWKLVSDDKELLLDPTNPIVDEKKKDKIRESCDMRVGGQQEAFVLAIVSGSKNNLWFISETDQWKLNLSAAQKESIFRVYNAYNRGMESMLKSQ